MLRFSFTKSSPYRWLYWTVIGLVAISVAVVVGWSTIAHRVSARLQDNPLPIVPIVNKTFGESATGRAITGYEIGTGEHCLVFTAGLHGNEKGGVSLLGRLVEQIRHRPSLLATNKKLIIIPLVNPDGYYDRQDKLNANAVNVNRNFATEDWIRWEDEEDPETFAGEAPFSETESRVVRDAVASCDAALLIDFHSLGALVSPETTDESLALASWYAGMTGYTYFEEWAFAGHLARWFEETTGNPSLTVELTNHADSDWRINRVPLLKLIASPQLPF